jgi:cell division protein FtsI (penicillin-binding protein 3)
MPNVKYMTARDAIFLLEEMGLKVQIQGAGKVIEQSLTAGQRVAKGDLVTLKLRF